MNEIIEMLRSQLQKAADIARLDADEVASLTAKLKDARTSAEKSRKVHQQLVDTIAVLEGRATISVAPPPLVPIEQGDEAQEESDEPEAPEEPEDRSGTLGARIKRYHRTQIDAGRDPPTLTAIAAALGVTVAAVMEAVNDTPKLFLDGDEEKPETCCVYYEDGR